MSVGIKAIETRYAGHRFRSRLEARWAVFFDVVGIRWQYEPEGYELPARLSYRSATLRYLPDFFLPDHELHVEVKGALDDGAMLDTLDCIAALSCAGGAGRHDSGGHDVVFLGPIPLAGVAPAGLCMNKGDLEAAPWTGQSGCLHHLDGPHVILAADLGDDLVGICWETGVDRARSILLGGLPSPLPPGWAAAYQMARQARFEHGETPRAPR